MRGQGGEAKFWTVSAVSLAGSHGLDARTLRELEQVVTENVGLIEEKWNEYFPE